MPKFENIDQMELFSEEYTNNYQDEEVLFDKYALSNDFVRLPKNINTQPLKVLGLILSKIDFTKDNRDPNGNVIIECTLSEIRKACGVSSKDTNYEYYKDVIKSLIKSSYVEGTVNGVDIMGYAVPWVTSVPEAENITFKFKLFNDFLPYFQLLASNYTIIELEQAKKFKSRFSYTLYMNLLSWREYNKECFRFYTTKQLKEMFGLDKDDYCRKNGKFDRPDFEKKTIDVAISEINKLTTLRVMYKKNYKNRQVANYQFNFIEYSKDLNYENN